MLKQLDADALDKHNTITLLQKELSAAQDKLRSADSTLRAHHDKTLQQLNSSLASLYDKCEAASAATQEKDRQVMGLQARLEREQETA